MHVMDDVTADLILANTAWASGQHIPEQTDKTDDGQLMTEDSTMPAPGTPAGETPGTAQDAHPGLDGYGQGGDMSGSQLDAPHWTSRWRARYRPGNWLVLSGPTSLVVLQPAAPQWSDLINTVWEAVLEAASIDELATSLAAFRLDEMPDLAALFWGADGMRSLVRGHVMIVDPRSDMPVASGAGIQTWTEIGLGSLQTVRITTDAPSTGGEGLELPLVVGAVQASEILLDASREVQLVSPQGTYGGPPESAGSQHLAGPTTPAESSTATPEPPAEAAVEDAGIPEPAFQRGFGGAQAPEPESEPKPEPEPLSSAQAEDEMANTMFASSLPGMSGQVAPVPTRAVAAILRPSSGGETDVDRPVLIGRAPEANRIRGDQLPQLLTVSSPSQDISRTHVQVTPGQGQVIVTDMHSTNGTILVQPGGHRATLSPGEGVAAEHGSVIDMGDGVTVTIDRPNS